MRKIKTSIENNRNLFLSELRSGKYTKGCTKSDEKTGNPIFEKEEDFKENTACSCAIMGNLFGEQNNGKISLPKATKALGLKSTDCKFIQQEINDRKSTLQEDAEVIETLFFDEEKLEKLKKKVDEKLKIEGSRKTKTERIYISKIIHDFKLSGKTIII